MEFVLSVQRYLDERRTPLEDGATPWPEADTPWRPIATVRIPAQDLLAPAGLAARADVERTAFNPWNAPPEFRPLGNLNRARRAAYAASAENWT